MEELDYEDVLSIHPDEDLKKIEPNETYADSPIEETIETDANSNLEPTIDIDANSPLEGAIEADANSPLEGAIEADANSNLEPTIEFDANSPLEGAIETDADSCLEPTNEVDNNSCLDQTIEADINSSAKVAFETDANSNLKHGIETDVNSNIKQVIEPDTNLEHASDSDSGEIDDDEEANDLEEGEIKENTTVLKKKSEIACRFFKRGSCAFGSQCQYLHVSDTVYKMFETNPPKRKDLPPVNHQHFIKPIVFSSNVLPPRPFIEPPIISLVPKADFPRQYDSLEDNWERCLEQARMLVQKKRKRTESEPKSFNSKNNDDERVKGLYSTNNLPLANSKKYGEKTFTNSNLRRADAYDEKKSNYRYQPRSSDKWVDPWRRSKSRHRSHSGSPPSRTRKHSYSSSSSSASSSSSEFDEIYKRSYKKKSPTGGRVSKSRSISQPRQSKKRRISPKLSFNGRRNVRSSSRSLSRSPSRKRFSRSRSRTSSCSSSSSSDREVSPLPAEKEMQRISAKLNEQFHNSPNRASSLLRSDCETSELTVSSASCTSVSSDSETESPRQSPSLKRKQPPIRNNSSSYSNKTANPKIFNRNESNLLKSRDVVQRKNDVPASQKRMQPYSSGKNQNNWNSKTQSADSKPKNAASNINSGKKPASEFSKNQRSNDMNLLFMYQDLRGSNKNNTQNPTKEKPSNLAVKPKTDNAEKVKPTNLALKPNKTDNAEKVKPTNLALKPNKTDNTVKVANKTNSNSETNKVSRTRKVSSHDMDMLFIYQGLGKASKNGNITQNAKTNNPPSSSNETDDALKVANTANNFPNSHKKLSNVTQQNIVLNLQPKSKGGSRTEIHTKVRDAEEMVTVPKKEATSKREKLLNKLKLIDDAIARKKCK